MAERVARAVGEDPRRRFGFGTIAAALIAATVLLAAGVFTSAPAAQTVARAAAVRSHQAGSGASGRRPNLTAISARVNSLLGRMTVAEKFGQLEMSGP
jgi:hypothetical protein